MYNYKNLSSSGFFSISKKTFFSAQTARTKLQTLKLPSYKNALILNLLSSYIANLAILLVLKTKIIYTIMITRLEESPKCKEQFLFFLSFFFIFTFYKACNILATLFDNVFFFFTFHSIKLVGSTLYRVLLKVHSAVYNAYFVND